MNYLVRQDSNLYILVEHLAFWIMTLECESSPVNFTARMISERCIIFRLSVIGYNLIINFSNDVLTLNDDSFSKPLIIFNVSLTGVYDII